MLNSSSEATFSKLKSKSNFANCSNVKPENAEKRPVVDTLTNKPGDKADTVAEITKSMLDSSKLKILDFTKLNILKLTV